MENEISFKYELREYQKRALSEIDKYIDDEKIHIVAAPGAGKTILALKLVFEFNHNTMILVPTIAIREQWVERMLNDFTNVPKDEIGTDLKNIKKFNVVSYQALYEYKKEDIEEIIRANNIGTIVLDEAHHLRNAWWKVLSQIFEEFPKIKIVALTATPPYDDEKNYDKYISLCGEIDAQINIPELVGQKNLCPHQDFIYFNVPTKEQIEKIDEYRSKSINLIREFEKNENFIKAIATHKYIVDYKNNVDEIIENFDFFSSAIKFLNNSKIVVDQELNTNSANSKMKIKDYEILFSYLIYSNDEEFNIIDKEIKSLKNKLVQIGAVDKKVINLLYNPKVESSLSENLGKLDSINEIIKNEYNNLGDNMKMVITTDYIKDDYSDFEENELNQSGVMPIFNNITDKLKFKNVCVLTGSVVIIPTDAVDVFKEICVNHKIKEENVNISEIKEDFRFSRVEMKNNAVTVKVITELFEREKINILIGTVALIGEGWDAPFVNTLIMASAISSYVTTNQIRGRAIRIDKNNLSKEANIWHLACLEKVGDQYVKGRDFVKIERRFKAIEGLALEEDSIISGIDRFKILEKDNFKSDEIANINTVMVNDSQNRAEIYKRWFEALKTYIPNNRIFVRSNKVIKNKNLIYKTKIRNLKKIGSFNVIALALGYFTFIPFGLACAGAALYDVKEIVKFFKNHNYDETALRNISKTIFESLKKKNLLNDKAKLNIKRQKEKYEVNLLEADLRSQNLFIKCVEEAISKKCNTRYLLIADDKVFNVPSIFDKNKESAEYFAENYRIVNFGSKTEIIYSKNDFGKLEKLKLMLNQTDTIDDEQQLFDGSVDVDWLKSALDL